MDLLLICVALFIFGSDGTFFRASKVPNLQRIISTKKSFILSPVFPHDDVIQRQQSDVAPNLLDEALLEDFPSYYEDVKTLQEFSPLLTLQASVVKGFNHVSDVVYKTKHLLKKGFAARYYMKNKLLHAKDFDFGYLEFQVLCNRTSSLEKTMDALEKGMDALEKRMDALEKGMGALVKRMDTLEKGMYALVKRMDVGLADLTTKVDLLTTKIDLLTELVREHVKKDK